MIRYHWLVASLAMALLSDLPAIDFDGNAGGNSLFNARPTGSAGEGGGGSSRPGGYMRNAANEENDTTTETLTEYANDPANLYWRQGKHALAQGQYDAWSVGSDCWLPDARIPW